MADPVIRPGNGLLLLALQSADDTYATPSALTDALPYEEDSIDFNGPFKTEQSNESNGSFAAGAPLVIGQPATFSFKARLKGAGLGATYTTAVKPPHHAALAACGWMPLFTAALAAAALTAGTANSATLGTGAAATAQAYRGMPLMLTGAPAAGRCPLIVDYSAAKVATLAESYGAALSTSNQGAIPANWSYAPTSPVDAATRASMHPSATIAYYEDGVLHRWGNCRGTIDFEGSSARPGMATFSFTGVYLGRTDAAMPTNAVIPGHSAPLLVQGSAAGPAAQIAGKPLPISKWSLKNGGEIETPDDPNTTYGFGAGQITDRTQVLQVDPLMTQVAVRDTLAAIASYAQVPAALQFGATQGNRWSLLLPTSQPTDMTPGTRGKLRSETINYQALSPGRDSAGRDGDAILCFY